MLFRVLAGRHTAAGQVYSKDDVVDSDRDLVALFGDNKFKREIELEMKKASPAASPKSTKRKTKEQTSEKKSKDVTEDFDSAVEMGLTVSKIGRKYFIFQDGESVTDESFKLDEVNDYIDDNFEAE